MTLKIFFFWQKIKMVSKNAEFHADFESVEKVVKKCTKKVISKTSLTNMSKSEKSAYFLNVFDNNFFLLHFFKTFSTDSKSAWKILRFLIPYWIFEKKNFFALITTFLKTLIANAQETTQKNGKSFLLNVA